ncbi:hypothetical protein CCYN49044_60043 [Capnocytophaga cynodegmi]|nr:hypothetical protein CCYN49044_60043 [Capnocytophaga cynodegmi]
MLKNILLLITNIILLHSLIFTYKKKYNYIFIGYKSFLSLFAQTEQISPECYTANNKGFFYVLRKK